MGPALARPGPLRRDQRLRARLGQAVCLAVSRLCDRRAQSTISRTTSSSASNWPGDELDPASAESLIATGFYRLGIWDDEPADRELARFDGLDGVISTTGQVFLGMSVNCARCHDHKVDPIPQRDYYRLLAFFGDVDRSRRQEPQESEGRQSGGRAIEVMCVAERGRADTFVLLRGNPDLQGDKVEPGVPADSGRARPCLPSRDGQAASRWPNG